VSERRGLVLGGGGVTGIAWETGLLLVLQEAGVDLTTADLVVGTSAGSVVGAQVTTGCSLGELYEYQLRPPRPGPTASIGPRVLTGYAWRLARARGDLEDFGRRLGGWATARADAGRTPTLEARYDAIRERLPVLEWPADGRLVVTAVDAATGVLRCFSGADDVPLLDAVTASCAVPGVYPPVPIGGRRYVDGGARSGANADLAASCSRVVALTPVDRGIGPLRSAGHQLRGLRHVLVSPDQTSVRAIGRNVLDPANRAASARAGRMQAESVAEEIGRLWGAT
jgi:NTE family protein